jgi:ABC-2 type transport system ATP-binding protein/heme exporter protein A
MTPTSTPRLQAHGLFFGYGTRTVVRDWSGDFGPGLTWLRGRNGSGKSTLMGLLAGALRPRAGERLACGIAERHDPEGYRRLLCWLSAKPLPLDFLSPAELAAFYAQLFPRFDRAAYADAVHGLALERHLHERIGRLSTGTQRKAWLAALLASGTPVCLLDEPGNALDDAALGYLQARLAQARAQVGPDGEPARCIVLADHREWWRTVATATLDLDAQPAG